MVKQQKDVRWFYAGIAASSVAVIGGAVTLFPSWIVGSEAVFSRILLQCLGAGSCAFAVLWLVRLFL